MAASMTALRAGRLSVSAGTSVTASAMRTVSSPVFSEAVVACIIDTPPRPQRTPLCLVAHRTCIHGEVRYHRIIAPGQVRGYAALLVPKWPGTSRSWLVGCVADQTAEQRE